MHETLFAFNSWTSLAVVDEPKKTLLRMMKSTYRKPYILIYNEYTRNVTAIVVGSEIDDTDSNHELGCLHII